MHFIFHLFVCLDVGKIMSFGINVMNISWRFTLTLRTICQIRAESKILSFYEKSGSKKTRILACFMQFGVCLCSFKIFTYLPAAKKTVKTEIDNLWCLWIYANLWIFIHYVWWKSNEFIFLAFFLPLFLVFSS